MSEWRIGGRKLMMRFWAKVHVRRTDLKKTGGELDIINELIYVDGVSWVVLVVHIA